MGECYGRRIYPGRFLSLPARYVRADAREERRANSSPPNFFSRSLQPILSRLRVHTHIHMHILVQGRYDNLTHSPTTDAAVVVVVVVVLYTGGLLGASVYQDPRAVRSYL